MAVPTDQAGIPMLVNAIDEMKLQLILSLEPMFADFAEKTAQEARIARFDGQYRKVGSIPIVFAADKRSLMASRGHPFHQNAFFRLSYTFDMSSLNIYT